MTEIEKQALALLDEVCRERGLPNPYPISRKNFSIEEALCRALEQSAALQAEFDQFRQEVSDAVEADVNKQIQCGVEPQFRTNSVRFVLPKPDPLVEAMNEMGFGCSEADAKGLRDALAKRNARIVWETE